MVWVGPIWGNSTAVSTAAVQVHSLWTILEMSKGVLPAQSARFRDCEGCHMSIVTRPKIPNFQWSKLEGHDWNVLGNANRKQPRHHELR